MELGHRLDGRTALVTGASGGIGREVCVQLAARGVRIAAHFNRRREAAEATLRALDGDGHFTVGADLADVEAIEAMIDRVVDVAGGIDILVNNAGIFERHPPATVSFDEWRQAWRRTLAINLEGPAHAAFCAARHMRDRGGGRIINVSSRGAFRGEPDCPAYGASKAGLNALSGSLAQALAGDGIYVFAVAPGFVETAMARDYLRPGDIDAIRAQSPLGRIATTADVAYWVVCMAAEPATFATGAIIDVNGASYLRT